MAHPVDFLQTKRKELREKEELWRRGARYHRYSFPVGLAIIIFSIFIAAYYSGSQYSLITMLIGIILGILTGRYLPKLDKKPVPPRPTLSEHLFLKLYPAYDDLANYLVKKQDIFRRDAVRKLSNALKGEDSTDFPDYEKSSLTDYLILPDILNLRKNILRLPKLIKSSDLNKCKDITLALSFILGYLANPNSERLQKAISSFDAFPPKWILVTETNLLLSIRRILWPHFAMLIIIIVAVWIIAYYFNIIFFGTSPSGAYNTFLMLVAASIPSYLTLLVLMRRKK